MSFKATPHTSQVIECEQSVRVYSPIFSLIANLKSDLKNYKVQKNSSYRFDYEILGRGNLIHASCWAPAAQQLVRTHGQTAPVAGRPDELMQRRYSSFGPTNPMSTPPLNLPHCQVATLSLNLFLFQSKKAFRKRLQNAHPAKSTAPVSNSLPVSGTWF